MTLATMLRATYWAQNQCSYQKAEEIMRNVYGIFINDDTIRKITNYIGEIVFTEDCRKADELCTLYNQGKMPYPQDKTGILYIETDGAALNTRLFSDFYSDGDWGHIDVENNVYSFRAFFDFITPDGKRVISPFTDVIKLTAVK
jgi:hypothetical protein